MFRLHTGRFPTNPTFPGDLQKLGFFIDAESKIKKIQPPHDPFTFWISNNERVNEAYREAMHECITGEISNRMITLGMRRLYLPQITATKPDEEPSVPIFLTNKDDLKRRKRVIVFVNDDFQDPGVFSYRTISNQAGLEGGSILAIAKAMQGSQIECVGPAIEIKTSTPQLACQPSETSIESSSTPVTDSQPLDTISVPFKCPEGWKTPGLVVLNPGQLVYSYQQKRAMTMVSWEAKPRPSGVHPTPCIDAKFNRIKGNMDIDEHVKFVFDMILTNSEWVAPDVELYVIGASHGSDAVVRLLSRDWSKYKERIAAIVLTDPMPIQDPIQDQDFAAFLRNRGRALVLSHEPLGAVIAVPSAADHRENLQREEGEVSATEEDVSATISKSPWLEEPTGRAATARTSGMLAEVLSGAVDTLASQISHLAVGDSVSSPSAHEPDRSDEWGYHYYPMLSSGVQTFAETILPAAYRQILAWFETIAANPDYRNPRFTVPAKGLEGAEMFDAATEQPSDTDKDCGD